MPSSGTSPGVRSLQGKVAAARRWGQASQELERDYAAERLAEHVARVVAQAPPLTSAQRDRIAGLLRAGGAS